VGNFDYDDGVDNGYNDGYGGSSPLFNHNSLTDVGAYVHADNYYDTFDQGGNAWEMLESAGTGWVEYRGGSWSGSVGNLRADLGGLVATNYTALFGDKGFRLAAAIPEPSGLAALAAMTIASLRRRRGR
jgi:hypothetical protein